MSVMPCDALFGEGVFDVLELEVANDGFDFFHGMVLPDEGRCAAPTQKRKNRFTSIGILPSRGAQG